MTECAPSGGGGLAAVETWIFDLDNTLYDVPAAMHEDIDRRLGAFVSGYLGVDPAEARRIQKSYFREFGLTLRGLMVNHGLDPAVYQAHMAGVDLSAIRPNVALARAIAGLRGRKIVFTNAFAGHARAVLDILAMTEHFEAIHDIEAAEFRPKPDIESYRALCARYAIEPGRAAMIDDIPHNLAPASRLGMTTVWVRSSASWAQGVEPDEHIDHVTDDIVGWLSGLDELC